MRRVFEQPAMARAVGERGRALVLEGHGLQRAGRAVRSLLAGTDAAVGIVDASDLELAHLAGTR
jgi:hypothetical protein